MNEKKLYAALGFAMKAGKCLCGDFICEKALKGGRAKLILLDASASQSTRERYDGICARENIPLLCIRELDAAIGKEGRKVAAVTDGGFARLIIEAREC